MLMGFSLTVRRLLLVLALTVFFFATGYTGESSLFSLEQNLNDLVYELSRSVVTVEASRGVPAHDISGESSEALESVISSGIVIDSSGHIVVIAGAVLGKDRILVNFDNRVVPAEVLAVDYQSDLALLSCPSECGGRPVMLSAQPTCAGQMVVAMGNAYGVRSAPSLGFCAGVRNDGLMQFSIPVTSGNVGGGIFDLSGRLVGVIVGGLGDQKEVTLAVPAYRVRSAAKYLATRGDRLSGFVGVTTREIEITPGIQVNSLNVKARAGGQAGVLVKRGVVVTAVQPGSPAEKAGLAIGDMVFSIDGMLVNSAAGLASLVRRSQPGRMMTLELIRRNTYQSLVLEIGRRGVDILGIEGDARTTADEVYLIDSLAQALEKLKREILQLEKRLNSGR